MRVHFDALRRPARVAKTLRTELEALGVTVGLGRAQDILAQAYGYASYRELQSVVGLRPADPWDEDATPEVAQARRKRQAEAIASAGVALGQAEALVARIGPSARQAGKVAVKDPGKAAVHSEPTGPATSPDPGMPEVEGMQGPTRSEDRRAMASAVSPDAATDGEGTVLLDNGWLLCVGTMRRSALERALAWRAAHPDRPLPRRVMVEDPAVVAAFKAGIEDPDATAFEGIGNPAARLLLRNVLREAGEGDVSEVTIVHEALDACIRFRIDGRMLRAIELTRGVAAALCSEAFALSDANDSSYRPDSLQAGRLAREIGVLPPGIQSARLQWVPLPDGGRQLSLRLFESNAAGRNAVTSLAACGYGDKAAAAIERMRRRPSGLNIVAGPALSGKSRSLVAILSADLGRRRVAAVDDGTGPSIPWATQVVADRKVTTREERKEARLAAIGAAMEGNPDVLVIGEISDFATASLAFKAAMSGLQVWATVRATDAVTALSQLRDLGIESYRLHDPKLVTGLVGQRLVRVTCQECSIGYDEAMRDGFLDPGTRDALDRFSTGRMAHRMRFANPNGCHLCSGGYKGQRLVAEAILPDRGFMGRLAAGRIREDQPGGYGPGSTMSMLGEAVSLALGGEIDLREVEDRVGFLDDLDGEDAYILHRSDPEHWHGEAVDATGPEVTAA